MTVGTPEPPTIVAAGIRQVQSEQQSIDTDPGNGQNRYFAERIETPEIHQNHVDYVGAAATRNAVIQKKRSDTAVISRQYGIVQHVYYGVKYVGLEHISH